jgi:gas vesicle protein
VSEFNGNGKRSGGFLMGAVVGAAVGAGIALLYAPRTGKEARNWLASSTKKLKDNTTNAFEQAKDTVRREAKGMASDVSKEFANVHDRMR